MRLALKLVLSVELTLLDSPFCDVRGGEGEEEVHKEEEGCRGGTYGGGGCDIQSWRVLTFSLTGSFQSHHSLKRIHLLLQFQG